MGFFKSHETDHVAAALIRRHFFQQFRAAVQYSDPRRAKNLMTGEGVEIAIEILHVDF